MGEGSTPVSGRTTTDTASVEAEVRGFFDRCVDLTHELFIRPSPDRETIGTFVEATQTPTLTTTNNSVHLSWPDMDAKLAWIAGTLQDLRDNDYAGHNVVDRSVRILNDRAALLEATWLRHNRRGEEFQRARWLYLIVKTDAGWRIDASITREAQFVPTPSR